MEAHLKQAFERTSHIKRNDASAPWIYTGIWIYSQTGKLEINEVCRQMDKSKSSFYNIYPNVTDSRGFDRFTDDCLDLIERNLVKCYSGFRDIADKNKNTENALEKIAAFSTDFYVYHKCLAYMRLNALSNPEIRPVTRELEDLRYTCLDYVDSVLFETNETDRKQVVDVVVRTLYDYFIQSEEIEWSERQRELVNLRNRAKFD